MEEKQHNVDRKNQREKLEEETKEKKRERKAAIDKEGITNEKT